MITLTLCGIRFNLVILKYKTFIHNSIKESRSTAEDWVLPDIVCGSAGKEHNFRTYDDTVSSALGVPYDYGSVMHYSKTSFNIGSEPTIVTKIPFFEDVIGQRMGFSASDLTKLNHVYKCSE